MIHSKSRCKKPEISAGDNLVILGQYGVICVLGNDFPVSGARRGTVRIESHVCAATGSLSFLDIFVNRLKIVVESGSVCIANRTYFRNDVVFPFRHGIPFTSSSGVQMIGVL